MKQVSHEDLIKTYGEAETVLGLKLGEIVTLYITANDDRIKASFDPEVFVLTHWTGKEPLEGFVYCTSCAFWHNRPYLVRCPLGEFFMIREVEDAIHEGIKNILERKWETKIHSWKLLIFLTRCKLYHKHIFIGEREKIARKLNTLGMKEDWQTLEERERRELKDELARYAPALVPDQGDEIPVGEEKGEENG